ncbi:DUF86 domain-containing protein [Priestia flexa]|uniref:DUF86 domain-containing protein n=2 Tax=Priestia TaxID=2800373 RepID=A0A0V8JKV9_9BACI|nr:MULTISPECIES: DUF86 domain-containing protein [Bacillaceae]KSU87609.1 hypothetical protein AS180_12330 [Priestia veravalensis]KZB91728.1 hypothetical protein A2U94_09610 [Bacillus sp. VT 712]MBN8253094.1 DUF86 domain-containing protein [Priestia flexa]MBN8433733.1 DUF86 domain-containing protein [Priestia flexa]MBY6086895.1 DUF86 domain-containing protein [Priestia flexa]
MYFVDRQKIEHILRFYEQHLVVFSEQSKWESTIEKKALERVVHLLIENVLDVGNAMIDGFIMRDPGSYDDIIDILMDEKVVETSEEQGLKAVINLRKVLVQDYLDVKHDEVIHVVQENKEVLSQFPTRIRTYLENELGPVSAFRN